MLGWGTFFPLGLDINRLILLPKERYLVTQAMEMRLSENLGPNSINSPIPQSAVIGYRDLWT